MSWILTMWLQSFDTGYPQIQPFPLRINFKSERQCLDAEPAAARGANSQGWNVVVYTCAIGKAVEEKKP